MRALAIAVFLPLVACSDSMGPEVRWLHDAFVLDRLGVEITPAPYHSDLMLVNGGLVCPPAQSGQPTQEVYTFDSTDPLVHGQATIHFHVVCELELPDRIRYTYPATGESIIGTVWEGAAEGKGQVFQTKRLPSRATFLATIEPLGWNMETWGYRVHDDPAPEATFRRNR